MGGINITNDLAIGLKTDLDVAESVKLQHAGLASNQKNGQVTLKVGKQVHHFDTDGDYGINNIVESRLDEMFDLVEKELRKIGRSRKLPGGVVLVGGTAKIAGISEFSREKLQLAARLGHLEPLGGLVDTVQDSAYATAVGLMLLDMLLQGSSPGYDMAAGQPNPGVFGMVDGIIRRFRK
jgi:cell division protein FtsA